MRFQSNNHRLPQCGHSLRGSVLAAVLGIIVLLSFIVTAFLTEAKDKIRYYALFHNRDDLRVEAYSAMEVTLAVLNQFHEVDEKLWGPEQGWGTPLQFASYPIPENMNINVRFHDESGKLPLAIDDRETLMLAFDEMGLDLDQCEELTDGLIDWMDEDDLKGLNGFDGDDYRDLDEGYSPANRKIQTWDELKLIVPFNELFFDENGVPNEYHRQFTQSFSLYNTGKVNINAAPALVIQILERKGIIDPYGLNSYRAGRDQEIGTADDRLIRDSDLGSVFLGGDSGGGVGAESSLMEVEVEVQRGDASFLLKTLISWRGADPSAADAEPVEEETTQKAEAEGEEETDTNKRARGSAKTQTGTAAQLGYPFQIYWLIENRKN